MTTLQASSRQEQCNTLQLRIEKFKESQAIYVPGASHLGESRTTPATPDAYTIVNEGFDSTKRKPASGGDDLPELVCLWLLSAIPHHARATACVPGLPEKETRLRITQADDTLAELRCQLRISAMLRDFKRATIGGTSQGLSTKTHYVMQRFAQKTDRCTACYRAAYSALVQLDPEGDWKMRLQVLKPNDIHSPHRQCAEDEDRRHHESEGRRELS